MTMLLSYVLLIFSRLISAEINPEYALDIYDWRSTSSNIGFSLSIKITNNYVPKLGFSLISNSLLHMLALLRDSKVAIASISLSKIS